MKHHRRKGRKLTKSEQMARVRSKDTGLERLLRRTLWAHGLRYRVRLSLPGTPDLAFVRSKVAVFVDGCFWHECPQHYKAPATNVDFWRRKVARNVLRDRRADEELNALGWQVMRIWEHEIVEDLPTVVTRIREAMQSAKQRKTQTTCKAT